MVIEEGSGGAFLEAREAAHVSCIGEAISLANLSWSWVMEVIYGQRRNNTTGVGPVR